jgi:flagellar hook-associated protein 2
LAVASDTGQVSTAINQLVTDYNTAIGLVNAQFTVGTSGTEGSLGSDSTVVSLQSTLEQALNYVATPATGTTTTVSTLSDLGITMNTDGTLSLDSTTLSSALTNSANDVQNFFEGTALNGFANSMNTALNTYTEPANGAFTLDLSGISASNSDLTTEINDFETNYIANQQTVLTAMYSSAEIALQDLPREMQQIQAELGNNANGSSSS